MTAESPYHSAQLAATLRDNTGRRRGRGIMGLMILLLASAMLLSLAVMFLPLSHPHMRGFAPHSLERPTVATYLR